MERYDRDKGYVIVDLSCPLCLKAYTIRKQSLKKRKNKTNLCFTCFNKSDEKIRICQENTKKRKTLAGPKNGNYKGKTKRTCRCGSEFFKRISPSQKNKRIHIYCSLECKKRYSKSISKPSVYRGVKMRSSWEVKFAKHLDSINKKWEYEPDAFKTPWGWYTPDFYVDGIYIEIKGFFRDVESRLKYEYFRKSHESVLLTKKELGSIV